jgi:nucleoside-diphosphate-sugar epimerase
MKIFISGATGFIGQKLVEQLLTQNNSLHILLRSNEVPDFLKHENVHCFKGDLLDSMSLLNAMQGCEEVFHLAAYARAWHKSRNIFYDINVKGTQNVLDNSLQCNIRKAIIVSTAGVLPPAVNNKPTSETAVRRPGIYTEYERTKNEAEELTKEYISKGLPAVIINPTKVFGPGSLSENNSATLMIRNYLRGKWKIIPGNGNSIMNYVFVKDVVNGILLAMEKGKIGEQYILGGDNLSYNDFFAAITKVSGIKHKLFKIPLPIIMCIAYVERIKSKWLEKQPMITPEWIRKIYYDWTKTSEKAISDLGYVPRPFIEGLAVTIDWLKNAGQL